MPKMTAYRRPNPLTKAYQGDVLFLEKLDGASMRVTRTGRYMRNRDTRPADRLDGLDVAAARAVVCHEEDSRGHDTDSVVLFCELVGTGLGSGAAAPFYCDTPTLVAFALRTPVGWLEHRRLVAACAAQGMPVVKPLKVGPVLAEDTPEFISCVHTQLSQGGPPAGHWNRRRTRANAHNFAEGYVLVPATDKEYTSFQRIKWRAAAREEVTPPGLKVPPPVVPLAGADLAVYETFARYATAERVGHVLATEPSVPAEAVLADAMEEYIRDGAAPILPGGRLGAACRLLVTRVVLRALNGPAGAGVAEPATPACDGGPCLGRVSCAPRPPL